MSQGCINPNSQHPTPVRAADPPEELLKLSDMPAAPPATVTPIYSFSHSHNDLSALRIFLRVATQAPLPPSTLPAPPTPSSL